ncbi:MAG: hypothetical protein H6728_02265 [Myxococcales bacterium]|nr:hypothetical protein [Myxococcales bacterium]
MGLKEKLEKIQLPFKSWATFGAKVGWERHSKENCQKAEAIFQELFAELVQIGLKASEAEKLEAMKSAVMALNTLDEEIQGFIETSEREQLVGVFYNITKEIGLNPANYADGEGPASLWRSW